MPENTDRAAGVASIADESADAPARGPARDPVPPRGSGTRERIIDAAAEVFLEKGYTGTRVVDIARRAGYTSGALYGYFDSRAEQLAEAVARSSSEMLARLLSSGDAAVGAPDAETPGEGDRQAALSVLDAALDQLTEPLAESDQMLLDGVALAHREPAAGDRLAGALGRFREQLAHEDGTGLSPAAADMVVVLVLGVTAARALGLHDPAPESLRRSLADCLARDAGSD